MKCTFCTTLADQQMQQEQALPQQLEKEAADMQACVLKRIGTHEQDLRQDHRLGQD
jgi:radical SAM superfamily enzyme